MVCLLIGLFVVVAVLVAAVVVVVVGDVAVVCWLVVVG